MGKTLPTIKTIQCLESLKVLGIDQIMIPSAHITASQSVLQVNKKEEMLQLCNLVKACNKCHELASARTQTVFGYGNINSPLVFVGEAPGFEEDRQGLPFVGKAGQLLTKMIEAMGERREDVYICNVLKCRPPENRNPLPAEIENCSPYLWNQLSLINPKVICALGSFAAQTLLKSPRSISSLRGTVHQAGNFKVICTFHPAYLLRNPDDKKKAWEDLKRVMQELKA